MIDCLNEVYTAVAKATRETHPGVTVIGEYTRKPSKFPTVTLDETSNVIVDPVTNSATSARSCVL